MTDHEYELEQEEKARRDRVEKIRVDMAANQARHAAELLKLERCLNG